ncbi:hypothetical protein SmJEL517_g00267 [Synchytrium microbalum]|uniref:EamA domain-containing protein n=1 Tax=Synchytrium microbalum TaxID=1806994 RepID=A0A507CJ00_9FUNG|nr:uncharacterized protein SmJEL517_g00267 [Synchytrium microbalum]TPX38154.1 hypothetical protein SmJEL517_g00267 [Synchytrium microbalum]
MVDWTLIFPILTGCLLSVQAAVNGDLAKISGSKLFAVFVSYLSGIPILLIVWLIASRGGGGQNYDFANVEWWAFVGGALGALYLTAMLLVIPHVGAALTVGISVGAQLISAAILDEFGWMYIPQRTFTMGRGFGIACALIGNCLIMFSALSFEARQKASVVDEEVHIPDVLVNEPDEDKRIPVIQRIDVEDGDLGVQAICPEEISIPSGQADSKPILPAVPVLDVVNVLDWRLFFAVVAGTALALQSVANGRLANVTSKPFASLYSYVSATIPLAVGFMYESRCLTGTNWASIRKNAKYWHFTGGSCGNLYMLSATFLVQQLRIITPLRAVGVVGMIVGVALVTVF